MTGPCVTIGVPVYRGQDTLPVLLECLRTQSYEDIDVLISVDSADQASAEACKPFLRQDSRFRMHVQPSRLGWAGNTDWTMRHRRGDFYIYQQHDDLVSPTYVADLVEASARWPDAVICFSRLQYTGQRDWEISSPSLLGDPVARALTHLRRLDWVPLRGLIRGSALDKTSGLLLSDFDPFDSFGTEYRFMAELALLGEFRFVEGPIYFKSWHGENLSIKRHGWSRAHWVTANACLAAWMLEVIPPAGKSVQERRRLFKITLERFAGRRHDPLKWLRSLLRKDSEFIASLRKIRDQLKRSEKLTSAVQALSPQPFGLDNLSTERPALLREVFERLKKGGRFEPSQCMNLTWAALESRYFGTPE
jgi:glycosyltransferase involved in cell wall biosynthesis